MSDIRIFRGFQRIDGEPVISRILIPLGFNKRLKAQGAWLKGNDKNQILRLVP